MNAICAYCDDVVTPEGVRGHFEFFHPGIEWELKTWPDGTTALLADGSTEAQQP